MKYCKVLPVILLIIFLKTPLFAQCNTDFSFKTLPSDQNASLGRIELTIKGTETGSYTFKIYRISGEIKLIEQQQSQFPQKIVFKNLEPSDYLIKVEWGQTCQRTIGGIEGIQIFEKAEAK